MAELIVEDLPQLPERKQVLGSVINHTLMTPKLTQQLPQLISLSLQVNMAQIVSLKHREVILLKYQITNYILITKHFVSGIVGCLDGTAYQELLQPSRHVSHCVELVKIKCLMFVSG